MEKVVNSEWAASELDRLRQENDALRQELANLKGKSSVWQEELQRLHQLEQIPQQMPICTAS